MKTYLVQIYGIGFIELRGYSISHALHAAQLVMDDVISYMRVPAAI